MFIREIGHTYIFFNGSTLFKLHVFLRSSSQVILISNFREDVKSLLSHKRPYTLIKFSSFVEGPR